MKNETIDCVAMKDEIQDRIYDEIKDLSHDEQIEYYRHAVERAAPLSEKFGRSTSNTIAYPTQDASTYVGTQND